MRCLVLLILFFPLTLSAQVADRGLHTILITDYHVGEPISFAAVVIDKDTFHTNDQGKVYLQKEYIAPFNIEIHALSYESKIVEWPLQIKKQKKGNQVNYKDGILTIKVLESLQEMCFLTVNMPKEKRCKKKTRNQLLSFKVKRDSQGS